MTANNLSLTPNAMMQALEWSYDKVINGLPGQKNIYEVVKDYTQSSDNIEDAINKLVNFQITKAATSGFLTGFGGAITLPITVPVNVASVLVVQIRMIASIAVARGYDPHDDQIQTFIYVVLTGSSMTDIVKKAGITFGNKFTTALIKKRVPGVVLTKINQAVGFRLITKFGQKGIINLGKMVPVVGAIIGGSIDTVTTKTIAQKAKGTFTTNGINFDNGRIIIDNRNNQI